MFAGDQAADCRNDAQGDSFHDCVLLFDARSDGRMLTFQGGRMSRNMLFVITLLVVAILAGGVAYGMFSVGVMAQFEMSKMYFAAAVLAFLAFIFLLAMIFYAMGPEATASAEAPGRAIFDACVKVIPPLVTLIIGFYFGASQDKAPNTGVAASPAPVFPKASK